MPSNEEIFFQNTYRRNTLDNLVIVYGIGPVKLLLLRSLQRGEWWVDGISYLSNVKRSLR